jgi:hypothetical protein
MQLDRLAAQIRPRTPWEGLDLGFALGRSWFPALWGLWWLSALPIGAAAALWLPARPDLWILLVWWFKPLYEAPLLFWLSRALFGTPVSPRGLWRERREVLPLRLLPNLLWRRFHLARSFQLPLILLEGLGGRERRQRQRVMRGSGGTATWLTVICVHLESILWSSALVLAVFLSPEELPRLDASAALFDVDSTPYWISAFLYWLAMSVIGPFYVAAGFALYLTRRTELEAWDLELIFRRARLKEGNRRRRGAAAIGTAGMLALTLWAATPVEAAMRIPDPERARALAAEVLEGEDFGSKREIRTWVYVGEPDENGSAAHIPDWIRNILEPLARSTNLVAALAKWVLILLAAVFGVLALRRILLDLRQRRPGRPAAPVDGGSPERLDRTGAGDLTVDLEARVRGLIGLGDLRAALALLYRATLSRLVQRHHLQIPPSATESECLALVARTRPVAETALLRRLTGAWKRQAYGHRPPGGEEIEALLQDWRGRQGSRGES